MSDHATTVAELRQLVETFVAERNWHAYHSPKNLSMSLAIEVAELMEHFQWLTIPESRAVAEDNQALADVGEELADVLCYALAIANTLELDVTTIMNNKMVKNRLKYPKPDSESDT